MHLFLTGVLPFLAHNHPSAAAFLTCRSKNFHASIIPEFLSDEERLKSFCEARQRNEHFANEERQYKNLYNLCIQTPLMQFSPALVLHDEICFYAILRPLLATKYFTRTLQRCSFLVHMMSHRLSADLLQDLSKIRSLTKLDFGVSEMENEHLEIIINSFPSLETLMVQNATSLGSTAAFSIASPPPPATRTLRNVTLENVDALFAEQFVPHFTNLRKLVLGANRFNQGLDLRALSSSLSLLNDLSLTGYIVDNIECLKSCSYLSSLELMWCHLPDLSFLSQENSLSLLTTLRVHLCTGLSTSSFASLVHAPNLHVLNLFFSHMEEQHRTDFNNDCLQYLENMVHLRKLILNDSNIVGDSRLLKTLMQNLFQLEELNLRGCRIGNQGAIAGALYSTHSRLRVLNLGGCDLVDDDLNGIAALKNTLEDLDLGWNENLTSEGLMHCSDLVQLKRLVLFSCDGIDDLSPIKDCVNLEELNVALCGRLTDDSFKVFSEEPNSFPNLVTLALSNCRKLTEEVFEHLAKNNHLVSRLRELDVERILSPTARKNIGRLKGLN